MPLPHTLFQQLSHYCCCCCCYCTTHMHSNLKPPNLVVVNPYFKLLLLLPHTPFSRDPLITSTHTTAAATAAAAPAPPSDSDPNTAAAAAATAPHT